jgi:replication factor C small subunit
MSEPKTLVSELLRPQQLGDLTLPQRVIDRLQRMIDSGSIINMLFYGQPGLGKTSAARVIMKALAPDGTPYEINGSSATGIDFVRDHIQRYASCVSMFGEAKICFIDEAEFVSKNAQASLRKVVEDFSDNCRFLFAANDISKIIPAIRSRLMEICFDIAPADRAAVQQRLIERYERKLAEFGIQHEQQRLTEIVGIYYPDLRAIANHLEFEFAT